MIDVAGLVAELGGGQMRGEIGKEVMQREVALTFLFDIQVVSATHFTTKSLTWVDWAQRGKKISSEAADLLIAYIDNVIAYYLSLVPAGETC